MQNGFPLKVLVVSNYGVSTLLALNQVFHGSNRINHFLVDTLQLDRATVFSSAKRKKI